MAADATTRATGPACPGSCAGLLETQEEIAVLSGRFDSLEDRIDKRLQSLEERVASQFAGQIATMQSALISALSSDRLAAREEVTGQQARASARLAIYQTAITRATDASVLRHVAVIIALVAAMVGLVYAPPVVEDLGHDLIARAWPEPAPKIVEPDERNPGPP